MEISRAVFCTDQVSRDKVWIPSCELMRAYHRDVDDAVKAGVELGLPMQMQHDMHRLVGWSRPLGLYIDSSMVRSIGVTMIPSEDYERTRLENLVEQFWRRRHHEEAKPFVDELRERLTPSNLEGVRFLAIESVVASREGLAAELYPELFTSNIGLVDKDGLADYRDLLKRMKQVQPGVFHDPMRDVLLFAHKFFRKSLSHRNKLNAYFLENFLTTARKHTDLRVRLRLDPDIIGHPSSARMLVEREYWHGPKFDDDISAIPPGVSEHKSSERIRYYHGVDRTQFWWKLPETRVQEGHEIGFRTFEMEELIENESWGIGTDKFGCRYAHAEFSADESAITHFDGAIRAYLVDDYLNRIDTSIDKAGKHSEYSKLFRFDGSIPISSWKGLLTDFFQGNALISEYLGVPSDVGNNDTESVEADESVSASVGADLAALVSLRPGTIKAIMALSPELTQQCGKESIPYVEVGVGAVEDFLRSRLNFEMITTVGIEDGVLNLSRVCIGDGSEHGDVFQFAVSGIAKALRKDFDKGVVQRAAVPIAWNYGELIVTLTLAGEAGHVANALASLPGIVSREKEPAEWIERLAEMVKQTGTGRIASILWNGATRGVLEIPRAGAVKQRFLMPKALQAQLIASGDLNVGDNEILVGTV